MPFYSNGNFGFPGTMTEGSVPDARLTPNVPLKNQVNYFTAPQVISAGDARLQLANGNAVDGQVQNNGYGMEVQSNAYWNGANYVLTHGSYPPWLVRTSSLADAFTIYRAPAGTVNFQPLMSVSNTGRITEQGRAQPMGRRIAWTPTVWLDPAAGGTQIPVNTSNTCRYSLVGDTLFWTVYLTGLNIIAPAFAIRVTLPPVPPPIEFVYYQSVMAANTSRSNGEFVLTNVEQTFLQCIIIPNPWPISPSAALIGQGFYYVG